MVRPLEKINVKEFLEEEMHSLDDESIYNDKVLEELLDNDELAPFEAAFMRGYDEVDA